MLNKGKGRKNNREIKFYINSKRNLTFVLSQKSSNYSYQEQKICAQVGRILYVLIGGHDDTLR